MNPTTVLSVMATPGSFRVIPAVVVANPPLFASPGDTLVSDNESDRRYSAPGFDVLQSEYAPDRKVS